VAVDDQGDQYRVTLRFPLVVEPGRDGSRRW